MKPRLGRALSKGDARATTREHTPGRVTARRLRGRAWTLRFSVADKLNAMINPLGKSTAVAPVSSSMTAGEASKVAADFYAAFSKGDKAAMAQAYAPNAKFHDPLFGNLDGSKEIMTMWNKVLSAANPDTSKVVPQVQPNPTRNADGSWTVKVHWDASYDVGKHYENHVENHSDTTLTIKDGKIFSQRDDWDLHNWARQANPKFGGNKLADAITQFFAHAAVEVEAHKRGWLP